MQNLYNALVRGETEYKDNEIIQHPPTSTMLRAARILEALFGENQRNAVVIQALQLRESEALEVIETQRQEIEQLKVQQKKLYHELLTKDENENLQRICDGKQEVGEVVCDSSEPYGSDSNGEGSTTG